jgi:hypothetical protein
MAPKLRRILVGSVIALLAAAGPVAVLDYFLPHHAVLRIVGTETRRPVGTSKTANDKPGVLRDVFYIFAEEIETKKPRVFRNEDTGWGFPWYFKFNSADVQTTAISIAGERGTALFTYYGWRIQIFSVVPNVTNIKRAAPDEERPIPWFNIGFAAVVIAGTVWLALLVRGGHRRRLAREASKGSAGNNPITKDLDAG